MPRCVKCNQKIKPTQAVLRILDNYYHYGCPHPASSTLSGIELEVCHDIEARQRKGMAKYGFTVKANPLDQKAWLQHAYEEMLDAAIYLKRAIHEMEK